MNATTSLAAGAVVNGIDADDLRALIATVAIHPADGKTRWRVANQWRGQTRSRASVDGFEMGGEAIDRTFSFDIDEPWQLAGGNGFANPQEYLLGALNACMIVGFTALCALSGFEIEGLEIVTEGEIDLRGFFGLDTRIPAGYDTLTTIMAVKGSATAEEFQQVFRTVLETSPNVHNITRPVRLESRLIVA